MSDSGRTIGDCPHAKRPEGCCKCLRARVAKLERDVQRYVTLAAEMDAALSRIDYLCGPPNEMECSEYDVYRHEGAVVKHVESLAKRAVDLEATRQAHADIARGVKRGLGLKTWPDMGGKLFQDGVAKLVDALRLRAESAERERDALREEAAESGPLCSSCDVRAKLAGVVFRGGERGTRR